MSYAIICDGKYGYKLGIKHLALVDRNKTKQRWWTSDSPHLIMRFVKKSAAEFSCNKLFRNKPRVVAYAEAVEIVNQQEADIMHEEANNQCGLGWDDHKHD